MSRPEAHARPVPEPAPKEAGGWIRRMRPFMLARKQNVLLAFGVAIIGQGVQALVPVWSKKIVDGVIVSHRQPLAPWLTLLVLSGIVTFALAFVRRFAGGRVALDVQ